MKIVNCSILFDRTSSNDHICRTLFAVWNDVVSTVNRLGQIHRRAQTSRCDSDRSHHRFLSRRTERREIRFVLSRVLRRNTETILRQYQKVCDPLIFVSNSPLELDIHLCFIYSVEKLHTKFVLVSHWREVGQRNLYPTPSPRLNSRFVSELSNVQFVPDPCILNISGFHVGVTGADILMHLGKEELFWYFSSFLVFHVWKCVLIDANKCSYRLVAQLCLVSIVSVELLPICFSKGIFILSCHRLKNWPLIPTCCWNTL